MKKKLITKIMMMFFLASTLVMAFNVAPALGHIEDVLMAWAPLPPTIDGMNSPTDGWDGAAQVTVFTGTYAGSIFYVMNDENNLYLALSVADSTFTTGDRMEVRFDNDHNGLPTDGDDEVMARTYEFVDCHYSSIADNWGILDTQVPGSSVDGSSGAGDLDGTNFFEISHPLNSGDANDFSLSAGDIVGFCLRYFNDGISYSTTNYPPDSINKFNQQWLYGDIIIAHSVEHPVELCYDDGTYDAGISSMIGYQFAVKFSLPTGWTNTKILTARYYIFSHPTTFTVRVRDSDPIDGLPGNDLITPLSATPTAGKAWFDVDLTAYNVIVTGDFYIVMEVETPNEPILGYDDDSPIDLRSYGRSPKWPPGEWLLWEEKDLMIRAVIDTVETQRATVIGEVEYGYAGEWPRILKQASGRVSAYAVDNPYPNPDKARVTAFCYIPEYGARAVVRLVSAQSVVFGWIEGVDDLVIRGRFDVFLNGRLLQDNVAGYFYARFDLGTWAIFIPEPDIRVTHIGGSAAS